MTINQLLRLIENSAKRAFFLMQPQGDKLEYIVDQQFKTSRCKFQPLVPKGYADAEVIRISKSRYRGNLYSLTDTTLDSAVARYCRFPQEAEGRDEAC
jgi:hypothetical protein